MASGRRASITGWSRKTPRRTSGARALGPASLLGGDTRLAVVRLQKNSENVITSATAPTATEPHNHRSEFDSGDAARGWADGLTGAYCATAGVYSVVDVQALS